MVGVIDDDIVKMREAVEKLAENPHDNCRRIVVGQSSVMVGLSVWSAAEYYQGVLESSGYVEGRSRAEEVKELFERAIELLSVISDDHLESIKSRWEELEPLIEAAMTQPA